MTIICDPLFETATAVAAFLGERVHRVDGVPAAGAALISNPYETVVVLGNGVDLEDSLAFAMQLRTERPLVGVILMRDTLEVDILTQAIRAGIREVVQAQDGASLKAAVHRSRQLSEQTLHQTHAQAETEIIPPNFAPPFAIAPDPALTQPVPLNPPAPVGHLVAAAAPPPKGDVVVVFSAKGGTGKTTVATNLAVALATGGHHRVCLFDMALAFGDVAISLSLQPKRTVVDALSLGEELTTAKVSSLLTSYMPGMDCILAPVAPGDAERIPAPLVAEIITVLKGMYDYIIIDTPAQFSEHVLVAFDAAQHHVLVTTPEVPSLKNLRLTLDMLDLLAYEGNSRYILLNRSDADVGKGAIDVERVAKSPISANVPSSREVPTSVNRGKPLMAEHPEHPVSVAINMFAQTHIVGLRIEESVPPKRVSLGAKLRRRGA